MKDTKAAYLTYLENHLNSIEKIYDVTLYMQESKETFGVFFY